MGKVASKMKTVLSDEPPSTKRKTPAKKSKAIPRSTAVKAKSPSSTKTTKPTSKTKATKPNSAIPKKRSPPKKTPLKKASPKKAPLKKTSPKKPIKPAKVNITPKVKGKGETLDGKIEFVYDADTVILKLNDGKKVRIRLLGIDAPEMDQVHGTEARDALRAYLPVGSHAKAVVTARDCYGRSLAHIYRGATHVNQWLIRNGHVWNCGGGQKFRALEEQAKMKKLGLWAKGNPVKPSDHRKTNKK